MSRASIFISSTQTVKERARIYTNMGAGLLDALHLSSAVEGQADYFCTTDDRLYKIAKKINIGNITVVTPLQLVENLKL